MKRNEALPSNYLGKEDFPKPCLAQIAHVEMEDIKSERGVERKPVLHIMGPSYDVDVARGVILNGTNWDALEEITGESDSDVWKGVQIVIYVDPNVMFGAKRIGGVRIRAPRATAATAKASPVPTNHPTEDEPPPHTDADEAYPDPDDF